MTARCRRQPVAVVLALAMAVASAGAGVAGGREEGGPVDRRLRGRWPESRLLMVAGCRATGGRSAIMVAPAHGSDGEILVFRAGMITARGVVRLSAAAPAITMAWRAPGEPAFDPWKAKLPVRGFTLMSAARLTTASLVAVADLACDE